MSDKPNILEEYWTQRRGFALGEGKTEDYARKCEVQITALEHELHYIKSRYAQFEDLYKEVDSLKGRIEHQQEMYKGIIKTLTEEKKPKTRMKGKA